MPWTQWVVYHPEMTGAVVLGSIFFTLSMLGALRNERLFRKETRADRLLGR